MDLPKFLTREGNALLFNEENSTFIFFVPKNFFNNSVKVPIAEVYGSYVTTIGLLNWGIMDSTGKIGKIKAFNFPTMFMCKPYEIEEVKGYSINDTEPSDYVLLKFKKGDEVVSSVRVPQLIDNVEIFFKMATMTAKIPNTIPYYKIWELFTESARLNGFDYGLNIQLICLLISYLCRDPKDVYKRFAETDMSDMTDYKMIDIRQVPKFLSPYQALVSENWDEAVQSAILMKDKEDTMESPLEKIVTM
jgi:hypothetical protein